MPKPVVAKSSSPRRSRIVVPHKLPWQKRALASAVYGLLRLVNLTLRYEWHLSDSVRQHGAQPVIFCIWHNRLAVALNLYRAYIRLRQQPFRMAAMASASRDGAVVARVLEHFGVEPVRGSTSRRGPQALLEMTTWAERGYDLAVTPDGPRGPRYQVQEGVMYLAQLTGLPIVPAACQIRWKRCARSWDRFQIPLPFSRVVVRLGDLVRVPRNVTASQRETLRQQLEQTLRELGDD